MQARFLSKVIDNYQTIKSQASTQKPRHSQPQQATITTCAPNQADSMPALMDSGPYMAGTDTMDMESGIMQADTGFFPEMGNFVFSDNEMWEKMFAQAGFRLNDGVFMPDASGS